MAMCELHRIEYLKCIWLLNYSSLGLCQAVSSKIIGVKMLLVFTSLPAWEHADLHLAIRWSRYSLLLYCLGNCTETEMLRSTKAFW